MTIQRSIVLLPFPFSNQKDSKVRPAIIMSNNKYNKKSGDLIAVPLTSNLKTSDHALLISNENLEKGTLIVDSKVKADRIFSVDKNLIKTTIGVIDKKTFANIIEILLKILSSK